MENASGDGWNFRKGCAVCMMAGILCLHIGGESLRLKSAEPVGKHGHPEERPINSYEGFQLLNMNTSASLPSGEQSVDWRTRRMVVDGKTFVVGD